RIGTQDAIPRPVGVAVAPGGRGRGIRADSARVPHSIELSRDVAAVIALVQPDRLVFVEVLRGEQVARPRPHACRRPQDRGRPTASPAPTAWELPHSPATTSS